MTQDRDDWKRRAKQWLGKRGISEVNNSAQRSGKLKRKKAYHWGCVLNQVVETYTGRSLSHWRVPDSADRDPFCWPYLAVSCDQGSDGMSASFFLRWSEPLVVEFFWDPSHATWRDQEAAVKSAGLRSFAYLMCAVYNMQHSPWDSQARFWQMRESTDAYLQNLAADCPLLDHYLPDILREWGNTEPIDEELKAWAINRLAEQWETHFIGKGVKMCRRSMGFSRDR